MFPQLLGRLISMIHLSRPASAAPDVRPAAQQSLKTLLRATAAAGLCALAVALFVGKAHAASVLVGTYGHLTETDFNNALGAGSATSGQWGYVGSTATSFTPGFLGSFSGTGTGVFELKSSADTDTFGYSSTSYNTTNRTVFYGTETIGTTVTFNPADNPFLLWFSDASGAGDQFTVFTDGHMIPTTGHSAAAIDVFYNATTRTYALFYEDGGGSGYDVGGNQTDLDFNDMVVTFKVPEPASMALLGVGMIATGVLARRRQSAAPVLAVRS
jgi:hypothetical protein